MLIEIKYICNKNKKNNTINNNKNEKILNIKNAIKKE